MDTIKTSRLIRRSIAPAAVVLLLLLWWHYGLLTVPEGMDTMPASHPAGTVCVIAKRPGDLQVGAVVFVDLPEGGTVLSRVAAIEADGALRIEHDNVESRLPSSVHLGPLPRSSLRGLVLTAILPDRAGTEIRDH